MNESIIMKTILTILLAAAAGAQGIPGLPVPVCSGTAEVLNDSIYLFGGAGNWAGSNRYPAVYKYDGVQWSYYDTIPDNNVWGAESAIAGNEVYLAGGWPAGGRYFRKYDLIKKDWTYFNLSPNAAPYGNTLEYVDNHIYLINKNGEVYEYDILNDDWHTKSSSPFHSYILSSAVFNEEIYLTGFYDSSLYKYNPSADEWIPLAVMPFLVSRCAMETIDEKIYCAGGSRQGSPADQYSELLIYDIKSDTWSVDQFDLSGKKVWMSDITYKDKFFVLGGIDSTSSAINIVEQVIPEGPAVAIFKEDTKPAGFSLEQNYPNPFNPSTNFGFRISDFGFVTLKIYDPLGKEIATVVEKELPPGEYHFPFSIYHFPLSSGVYFYRLKVSPVGGQAGIFSDTKKLILMK